jgi:hypothetical protein
VTGNTTEVSVDIPGDPTQWWSITGLDWSSDAKPSPIGFIEVTHLATDAVLWKQFFSEAGEHSKTFSTCVFCMEKGVGVRITVAGGGCEKTLGVFYQ